MTKLNKALARNLTPKRFAAAAFGALGLLTVGAMTPVADDEAHASGACKRVYLSAINRTGGTVKVIDVDYYVGGINRWKSEPTRNQQIPNGANFAFTRNLENAAGRRVAIRVEYRTRKRRGFGKWSKVKRATSPFSTCNSNGSYSVTMR